MRIERIADNRVQVILTGADLAGLNIDIKQLRPNSRELHSFLFNIMEEIREETGFNPYNGQVVVEAMPSKDGISIIVSKISSGAVQTPKRRRGRIKSVTPHLKKRAPGIFHFEEMEDLCGALVRVEEEALLGSTLYRAEKGYYFVLQNPAYFRYSFDVLNEFAARRLLRSLQQSFIEEHCEVIAEKQALVDMKNGIKGIL